MAESLNMNGLSLKDSQHAAPNGAPQQNGFEKAAYIPPHMRQRGGPAPSAPNGFDGGPPPPMANGLNSSAWAPPPGQQAPKYVTMTHYMMCGRRLTLLLVAASAVHHHLAVTGPALRPSLLAATGTTHLQPPAASIVVHTARLAAAVARVVQETEHGETGSTYQDHPTHVLSVSSSALPTIHQKHTPVSTLRSMTTFQ